MIHIFCDGSKTDRGAYIGIHLHYLLEGDYLEIMEYIGDYGSATAEYIAIYRSLELAMKFDQDAVVWTEMIGLVEQNHLDPVRLNKLINSRDWTKVLLGKISVILKSFPRIKLQYARAHSGNLLNSRADRLARGAHTMEWPIRFKDYKNIFEGSDGIVQIDSVRSTNYFARAFFRHAYWA